MRRIGCSSPDCGKVGLTENETIVAVRVVDVSALFIDYRLNTLGILGWEHSCQLIARSGKEPGTIGPCHLPVHVAKDAVELKTAATEPLPLTAHQYCAERPKSDLAEVLSGRKDVAAGLKGAVVPVVAAVA